MKSIITICEQLDDIKRRAAHLDGRLGADEHRDFNESLSQEVDDLDVWLQCQEEKAREAGRL